MSEPTRAAGGAEHMPLPGKQILVTRTSEQAGAFSQRLQQVGAIPIEFPTIRIVPPHDWTQLDRALKHLFVENETHQPYYTWLVLTSANGVIICCERLRQLGYRPSELRQVRVAAVGPATAAALARYGIAADLVPDEYVAEGVAEALMRDVQQRGGSLQEQRILLAHAAAARKVLAETLQQAGILVDEVAAYTTQPVTREDEQGQQVLRLLQQQQIDIITFTSASTVRNFVTWLQSCVPGETNPLQLCAHSTIACIGPITSQAARDLGLPVHIEPTEFTIGGLVEAIIHYEEVS